MLERIGSCDASDSRRRAQTGAIRLYRGSVRTFYKVVAGQQRLEDKGHHRTQVHKQIHIPRISLRVVVDPNKRDALLPRIAKFW